MAIKTKTPEQEYAETTEWLDSLDPETTQATPMPAQLRRVGSAAAGIDDAAKALNAAVREARAAGYSWGRIGLILGVSRQAAQHRFSEHP